MLSIFDISLRSLNFVFLVIILGLTGSLIHGSDNGNHSRVNFALFASVFGLVFDSIYGLVANFLSVLTWPIALFCLDFLNFVFTFAAATALAVGIRVHSCTDKSYLDGNSIINGSEDRCRKSQASVAFLYFSFFIFLAKLVFDIINMMSSGSIFGSKKRPSVSQV
ncbi:related to Non-classical export protein 2 [Hanseniaspora guilliermondii]|uniref:Related to Non-classical export protein 2 n=1 Tax=Hanseniaspora guilliermondii TaxID=56406 RepID=A0A1L0CMQ8_9ASCO|nr:related to Non-classical export protein 2 [Hanseniaspora guilliermondii]